MGIGMEMEVRGDTMGMVTMAIAVEMGKGMGFIIVSIVIIDDSGFRACTFCGILQRDR